MLCYAQTHNLCWFVHLRRRCHMPTTILECSVISVRKLDLTGYKRSVRFLGSSLADCEVQVDEGSEYVCSTSILNSMALRYVQHQLSTLHGI